MTTWKLLFNSPISFSTLYNVVSKNYYKNYKFISTFYLFLPNWLHYPLAVIDITWPVVSFTEGTFGQIKVSYIITTQNENFDKIMCSESKALLQYNCFWRIIQHLVRFWCFSILVYIPQKAAWSRHGAMRYTNFDMVFIRFSQIW